MVAVSSQHKCWCNQGVRISGAVRFVGQVACRVVIIAAEPNPGYTACKQCTGGGTVNASAKISFTRPALKSCSMMARCSTKTASLSASKEITHAALT